MVKMTLHALFLILAFVVNSIAIELTHFGYEQPGQAEYDSNSAQGIGAFGFDDTPGSLQNINASGVIAAALSPDVASQYGLKPGQQFSVNTPSGSYDLVYADKTADYLTGRIDLYDPSGTFQGSGTQVTSINGGAIIEGSPGNGIAVGAAPQTLSVQVVDMLLGRFKNAGQSWVTTLQRASTTLFWILALISLAWTGVVMVLKRSDLLEICAEVVRYLIFTGFFFWLLQNGPAFANDIISSLRQLGGQAAGGGQALFPGDLISLGIQVVNNSMVHMNWIVPAATGIPVLFAVVILVVCCLISANQIVLLCAAWVVLYAGLIFLGFGGCRWTSDWALGYWKTVLGIGASLMTMEMIIGIGGAFLKDIVQQTGNNGDIGQLMAVLVAIIILAVIAHQLPKMVAGMVQGGGYGAHVGHVGALSLLGAMFAGARLAGAAGASGAIGAAGAAGMSTGDKLMERIAAAAEVGNGNGASSPPPTPIRTNATSPASAPSSPAPASPPPAASPASAPQVARAAQNVAQAVVADDPPESRPTAPDEQRGFDQEPDFGVPQDDNEQA